MPKPASSVLIVTVCSATFTVLHPSWTKRWKEAGEVGDTPEKATREEIYNFVVSELEELTTLLKEPKKTNMPVWTV